MSLALAISDIHRPGAAPACLVSVTDRLDKTWARVKARLELHLRMPVAAPDDPRRYAADEILRDGGSIHLRAIRADDKQRLVEHFGHLSAQSVWFRFFGVKKRLSDQELTQFTELDFANRVALVATL